VDDIVVDKPEELLWRLRALYALKNTIGKKVVAIGGPWENMEGGPNTGVTFAKERFNVEPVIVPFAELGDRINKAAMNPAMMKRCEGWADAYLKQKDTTLETSKPFLVRSFVLTEVFRDLMDENKTDAFAVNQCLSTIIEVTRATACIPLQLLLDEGYTAVCQGDFVATPANLLLRYISGKPVFLNDPSFVHDGVMVLAHCTAPRKMDGQNVAPARIMTHYDSDYGAAPKVEFKKGQVITNVVPDYGMQKWMGMTAEIVGSPNYPVCRSQVDIQIKGDWKRVNSEVQGWHWQTAYGDYLREVGYAIKKKNIAFNVIT
jgi:L-fucose isomerase-like protein